MNIADRQRRIIELGIVLVHFSLATAERAQARGRPTDELFDKGAALLADFCELSSASIGYIWGPMECSARIHAAYDRRLEELAAQQKRNSTHGK